MSGDVYERLSIEDIGSGSDHVFCSEHGCWKFKDAHGSFVCVVCLVQDRLFIDEFEWVDDYTVKCPNCGKLFQGLQPKCPNCGMRSL